MHIVRQDPHIMQAQRIVPLQNTGANFLFADEIDRHLLRQSLPVQAARFLHVLVIPVPGRDIAGFGRERVKGRHPGRRVLPVLGDREDPVLMRPAARVRGQGLLEFFLTRFVGNLQVADVVPPGEKRDELVASREHVPVILRDLPVGRDMAVRQK